MPVYKHLLIIADGEIIENSLFQTSAERAAAFVAVAKDRKIRSFDGRLASEAIETADEAAAIADRDKGRESRTPVPEDHVDMLRDLLADNGIDVYLDDLLAPLRTKQAVSAL